jgi:hypothetical protein
MNKSRLRQLEKLAISRLEVTAKDDPPWSFLFETRGSVDFLHCPWTETEDLEFDGELTGLELGVMNVVPKWSAELISRPRS